jgi:hypothetical protein
VYVLNKGIFYPGHFRIRPEDEKGGAISNLYFTILNFLQRESARRDPAPYQRYITHAADAWQEISYNTPNNDVAATMPPTRKP